MDDMTARPEERPNRPLAESELSGTPVGRRVVLGLLSLGAIGVLTGRAVQDWLARSMAGIQQHDPTGLTGLLPLGDTFRYYSVTGSVPTKTERTYRLKVSGLVDSPTAYTLDQLQALPQNALTRDFQCVTGWRVPSVPWTGVLLADLLDAAGVQAGAGAVRFTCFDGEYTESLTLEQARRPDVIIALSMLGKPVTHDHGGPVRLYVAPMYGYKSAKWLSGIEVTAKVEPGYWESYGYDVDGWVGDSNGREDAPTSR
jgi:DMSO/TMAO reductase YedYZ molybdopterin-dependent catalytic subunit